MDTWFHPCHLVAVEGDHLRIGAPNKFHRDWVFQHHWDVLQTAAREALGGQPRLSIVVVEENSSPTPAPPPRSPTPPGGRVEGLNPRYTFDSFVVGSSNQFAQAASQAVAELPSRAYNPLFIYGKERTQEEFFHTFSDLYESRKQIIVSSDCSPKDIPEIEERLRSRFEWGLIADIQPPDFETRVAILRKKAALERVLLEDDVAFLIAGRIKSNIRELEGSLTRMIAFCALTGREMSVELAQEVLADLWGEDEKVITIDQVQRKVSDFFGVKVSDLKAKNRTKAVAFPRQVAMYLARQLTHASLAEVGRAFGGKDHTTVLHAVDKIQSLVQEDPKLKKTIEGLIQGVQL